MGDKIWMAENLKYLPFLSPMPADYPPDYEIPNSENPTGFYVYQFWGTSSGNAKKSDAYKTSGVLYRHYTAMEACPCGWHLSDNEEWNQMAQYISNRKGPYLKVEHPDLPSFFTWENVGLHIKSTTGWMDNNGLDDFGFSAYPGGFISAKYNDFPNSEVIYRSEGSWWTSTPKPPGGNEGPFYWHLSSSSYTLKNYANTFPEVGYSVRCVKDE